MGLGVVCWRYYPSPYLWWRLVTCCWAYRLKWTARLNQLTGSFFGLLTPFALVAGLLSVAMLLNHGAAWLQMKTDGFIEVRARAVSVVLSLAGVTLFVLAGLWVAFGLDGFVITSAVDTIATSNPLKKEVAIEAERMSNYSKYPLMMAAPVLGIVRVWPVRFSLKRVMQAWHLYRVRYL